MKEIIVLCALCAICQSTPLNNRILGGENAAPGQFPFIVSLRLIKEKRHVCGGTIISSRTVLTAAHCKMYDIKDTNIVTGLRQQNDGTARIYQIKSFTLHEYYDQSTLNNDIAVVIVTDDIIFSEQVQAALLATRPVFEEERLTTAGWGLTNYPSWDGPNDLQWMQTNVISHSQCVSMAGFNDLCGKICTFENKGTGICSGDSGGPLINERNELVGITSAAYFCALGLPDYFTDVYHFKYWIIDHINL